MRTIWINMCIVQAHTEWLLMSVQCANWLFPSLEILFENNQEKWLPVFNEHVKAHTAEISYDWALCKIIFPFSNPTFENTQCHRHFSNKSQLSNCYCSGWNYYSPNLSIWKIGFLLLSPDFSSVFLTVDYHLKANFSHNMHETSAPGPAHVSGTLKTGYPGRISGDIRPI